MSSTNTDFLSQIQSLDEDFSKLHGDDIHWNNFNNLYWVFNLPF